MTYILKRREYRADGIFSELNDPTGKVISQTLEHSYDDKPKLYPGTFNCVRGKHQLHGMTAPFETFEITGVDGHVGILFHVGNWNDDSDGCVLMGEGIAASGKGQMVTGSRVNFTAFMNSLAGVNEFTLIVE